MLKANMKAPEFTLPDENGKMVSLKDFKGKKVVLYFYPKDNTPGCTTEACSFRDNKKELEELNAVVIGISRDSDKSHQGFIFKHSLNFTLLTDKDNKVMEQYGAFGEKKLYGKTTIGVIRSTFIIDEDGNILKTYYKVNTKTHAEDVKKYLSSL